MLTLSREEDTPTSCPFCGGLTHLLVINDPDLKIPLFDTTCNDCRIKQKDYKKEI